MNMGYEDDELKPYVEPQPDLNDQKRIGKTGTVHKSKHITKLRFMEVRQTFDAVSRAGRDVRVTSSLRVTHKNGSFLLLVLFGNSFEILFLLSRCVVEPNL